MFRSFARASRVLRAAETSSTAKKELLTFTFGTPTHTINKATPVYMVTVPTIEGEMGVLAEHSPYLAELRPGLVKVYNKKDSTEPTAKYFVPAGFLVVDTDSSASVSAAEAIPLDDLDVVVAKKLLETANTDLAKVKDKTSDPEYVDARIRVEVYESMVYALEGKK